MLRLSLFLSLSPFSSAASRIALPNSSSTSSSSFSSNSTANSQDDAHDLLLGQEGNDPVRLVADKFLGGIPSQPHRSLRRRRLLPVHGGPPRTLQDYRQIQALPGTGDRGPLPPARRCLPPRPPRQVRLRHPLRRQLRDRIPPHARHHVLQRRRLHRRCCRLGCRVPPLQERRGGGLGCVGERLRLRLIGPSSFGIRLKFMLPLCVMLLALFWHVCV